jgi:predicted ATPase
MTFNVTQVDMLTMLLLFMYAQVDTLYERGVKLVCLAEAPPKEVSLHNFK